VETKNKKLGELGEAIARNYLKKKGYSILESNFKRKWGEIDIIGKKKGKIIFFEVKCIFESPGFLPEDKITLKKRKQLAKMAQVYLSENKFPFSVPCQIDIITIELIPKKKKARIRHYKNAVEDIW